MPLAKANTVPLVPSKAIPPELLASVARYLRAYMQQHCVDERGKLNQSLAAKRLGVSQAHISAILQPQPTTGVGLRMLLILRSTLNRPIDELLGLEPLAYKDLPPSKGDMQSSITLALEAVKSFLENDQATARRYFVEAEKHLDTPSQTPRRTRKSTRRNKQ